MYNKIRVSWSAKTAVKAKERKVNKTLYGKKKTTTTLKATLGKGWRVVIKLFFLSPSDATTWPYLRHLAHDCFSPHRKAILWHKHKKFIVERSQFSSRSLGWSSYSSSLAGLCWDDVATSNQLSQHSTLVVGDDEASTGGLN